MSLLCFQDSPSGATEEPEDQDVVLIKEEAAKEEASDHEASDELLLNADGESGRVAVPPHREGKLPARAPPLNNDDYFRHIKDL